MLYGESCIPASHNSFASISNGFLLWPQQYLSIKDQLQIGVRGFMLDTHADLDKKAVVLRHGFSNIEGLAKPINGQDILFYDTFKEFTNFLRDQSSKQKCATITILLENYVSNNLIYRVINKEKLAEKYLYKEDPNLARVDQLCNKIVLFTSHHKDRVDGIHPPQLYKENEYKYYGTTSFLGYNFPNFLKYEECENRQKGRATYNDTSVNIFCFNHFIPISALLGMNIFPRTLYNKVLEAPDRGLQLLDVPYKFAHAEQDLHKAFNSLWSLTTHLDQCKSQDIKYKFHPTIIAVDFVEKGSGVFLCYEDSSCSGTKCGLSLEEESHGIYDYFSGLFSWFYNNSAPESEL